MDTICWLKITDYMQGWLKSTLCGGKKVRNMPVISVRHIEGAREVMMMPAEDELPDGGAPGNAISATWRNALESGIIIDPKTMEKEYGVTREVLRQYLPIECPKHAVTKDGIIRQWTNDTCFGKQQATALLRLLREAFWQAVGEFSEEYSREHAGEKYAQVEMIESFCKETHTDDVYAEAMRREWQRRQKRQL